MPNPQPNNSLTQAVHDFYAGGAAGGDTVGLRRALQRYHARQGALTKSDSPAAVLRRAFLSFNLWPGGGDDYMDIIGDETPAEAIASHWREVGEYLSYGIATFAVGEEHERG